MNIEFIKWLVSYAKGFEYKEDNPHLHIAIPTGLQRTLVFWMDFQEWHKIYYPLLLQRAIEGINKTTVGTVIDQYCDYIEVTADKKDLKSDPYNQMFPEDIGFDAAKEAALKYMWEKME